MSNTFRWVGWLVAANLVVAMAGATGLANAAGAFRLGPGDKLYVVVWKQPALTLQVAVAPDGTLRFPLVGEIQAAGRTAADVEEAIVQGLQRHIQEPQVSVTLAEATSYRVYVLGEVQRPGEYQARGPLTVAQAIAMASGFSPFAEKSRVAVIGPPGTQRAVRTFDYERFIRERDPQLDFVLEPGDTVIVQ